MTQILADTDRFCRDCLGKGFCKPTQSDPMEFCKTCIGTGRNGVVVGDTSQLQNLVIGIQSIPANEDGTYKVLTDADLAEAETIWRENVGAKTLSADVQLLKASIVIKNFKDSEFYQQALVFREIVCGI